MWVFWLIVYLAGFVYWFRNRLKVIIRNHEKNYPNLKMDRHDFTFSAAFMAIFWPVTLPIVLAIRVLSAGIKTQQEVRQERLAELSRELEALLEVQRMAQNAELYDELTTNMIREKTDALRMETSRLKGINTSDGLYYLDPKSQKITFKPNSGVR